MIRINLLPIKQARKRETIRNQIGILLIAMIVEAVLCYFVYTMVRDKISIQRKENESIQTQIDQIKREIQDHEKITAQLKEIEEREKIIADLQTARTGPVFIMYELSRLLSYNGGPSIDKERYQEMLRMDPESGYDSSWDYRRIWLTAFKEKARDVRIDGFGLTHEDVAEFLRRLSLSDFFYNTVLNSTSISTAPTRQGGPAARVVTFNITSKVRYR